MTDPKNEGLEAFCCSGSSPTISVLGLGPVGRAFVRLPELSDCCLSSVSDRSGTLCHRKGLDGPRIAAFKEGGKNLAAQGGGGPRDLDLALSLVGAQYVVDCTDTQLDACSESLARSLAILDRGQCLVSAEKSALLADPDAFLAADRLSRFGFNAVLGGTGLELKRELREIQQECIEIVAVPNACTGSLIQSIEEGLDRPEAFARARGRGLLEADPEQDIDGRDAAIKITMVARLVFGLQVDWREVERPHFDDLDLDLIRWRRKEGRTTALVCRADREGVRLAYEELELGSTLAIPWRRVLYGYQDRNGSRRIMIGKGVGAEGTARALYEDLLDLRQGREERQGRSRA